MQLAALASLKAWQQLVCLFIFWKFLLLSIASLSPGPGYDTSTQLLFSSGLSEPADHGHSARFAFLQLVAEKLTRWDGIYLASLAHRGYVYEQEWAFSWGFTRLMSLLGKGRYQSSCKLNELRLTCCPEFSSEPQSALVIHALSGILLANLSHLLAVLVLYRLATLLTSLDQDGHRMAFLTAALHILSPAGLFLSAPYGESFFALLNFAGMLSYAFAAFCTSDIRADLSLILAGVSFGAAAAVRSNGLLSGVIFAADCVPVLHLIWVDRWPQLTDLHRLAVLGIAGSLTAAGFALPQVMAYGEYCTGNAGDDRREWCKRTLPSIYSWVQDHYWYNQTSFNPDPKVSANAVQERWLPALLDPF